MSLNYSNYEFFMDFMESSLGMREREQLENQIGSPWRVSKQGSGLTYKFNEDRIIIKEEWEENYSRINKLQLFFWLILRFFIDVVKNKIRFFSPDRFFSPRKLKNYIELNIKKNAFSPSPSSKFDRSSTLTQKKTFGA